MENNNYDDDAVAKTPLDVKLLNVILFACERVTYILFILVATGIIQVIKPLIAYSCYVAWCAIVLWLCMAKCAKRNPFNMRMFIDVLLDCFCAVTFIAIYY